MYTYYDMHGYVRILRIVNGLLHIILDIPRFQSEVRLLLLVYCLSEWDKKHMVDEMMVGMLLLAFVT